MTSLLNYFLPTLATVNYTFKAIIEVITD